MSLTLWVLFLYVAVFIWQGVKYKQYNWVLGSAFLCLGFGLLGQRILPYILGPGELANLYPAHFYIFVSSLFYFVDQTKWQTQKASKEGRSYLATLGNAGPYLPYLAISGLIMHVVYGAVLLIIGYQYPEGLSFYAWFALLQLYFLDPSYWIGIQISLMAILYLIGDNSPLSQAIASPVFSTVHCYWGGVFVCLAWLVYLIRDYFNLIANWL